MYKLIKFWKNSYNFEFEKNPDIRNVLKKSAYLYNFSHIIRKKTLLKKALENQWWQYFNRIFPYSIEQNPLKLPKYLPISYKKISDILENNNRHTLIIQAYLLNGWSVLLLLIITKLIKTDTPLYIFADNQTVTNIYIYLNSIFKKHGLPELSTHKIYFLNSDEAKNRTLLDAFKNGGIIFTLFDSPLSIEWKGAKHIIQLFNHSLTVSEGILPLAATYNIAILPITSFIHGYKLHISQHSIQLYTHLSLNSSTIIYTLEKLYFPLINILIKYPEKWLLWQDFNLLSPIFYKPNSPTKRKKMSVSIIQSDKLLSYSYKNTTFIINLENGRIYEIFKPIFFIIMNSLSRSMANKTIMLKYPNIEKKSLNNLLNLFYPL